MSARPCQIALYDCIGVDSPITGLPSEIGDPVLNYAYCGMTYNPYAAPTLGGGVQVRVDYSNVVYAGETQAGANAQAVAACSPGATGYEVFVSEAVTVTAACTLGDTTYNYTITLPAGYTIGQVGQSQEEVNAVATAAATAILQAQMAADGCNQTTPNYLTDDQGVVITDSDGNPILLTL